jgi:hypothetical protein
MNSHHNLEKYHETSNRILKETNIRIISNINVKDLYYNKENIYVYADITMEDFDVCYEIIKDMKKSGNYSDTKELSKLKEALKKVVNDEIGFEPKRMSSN